MSLFLVLQGLGKLVEKNLWNDLEMLVIPQGRTPAMQRSGWNWQMTSISSAWLGLPGANGISGWFNSDQSVYI